MWRNHQCNYKNEKKFHSLPFQRPPAVTWKQVGCPNLEAMIQSNQILLKEFLLAKKSTEHKNLTLN